MEEHDEEEDECEQVYIRLCADNFWDQFPTSEDLFENKLPCPAVLRGILCKVQLFAKTIKPMLSTVLRMQI